jgi:hypothetical protein
MEHYAFLKAWLNARWKLIPTEQVEVMLQAANAIESLELEIRNLRRELNRCPSHAAEQVENARPLSPCRLS